MGKIFLVTQFYVVYSFYMATASTTTARSEMVRIFYVNHGAYSAYEFTSLALALASAKKGSAEVAFHKGGEVLAAWSPIGGLRLFTDVLPVVETLLRSIAGR